MAICSGFTHQQMVVFHSYVSLPEGIYTYILSQVTDQKKMEKDSMHLTVKYVTLSERFGNIVAQFTKCCIVVSCCFFEFEDHREP